jgi:hypothetical protein
VEVNPNCLTRFAFTADGLSDCDLLAGSNDGRLCEVAESNPSLDAIDEAEVDKDLITSPTSPTGFDDRTFADGLDYTDVSVVATDVVRTCPRTSGIDWLPWTIAIGESWLVVGTIWPD